MTQKTISITKTEAELLIDAHKEKIDELMEKIRYADFGRDGSNSRVDSLEEQIHYHEEEIERLKRLKNYIQ